MNLYGQATVIHDGKLYTVGGTSGFMYFMDIHCLDLKTRIWERLADYDHERDAAGQGDIKPPEPR